MHLPTVNFQGCIPFLVGLTSPFSQPLGPVTGRSPWVFTKNPRWRIASWWPRWNTMPFSTPKVSSWKRNVCYFPFPPGQKKRNDILLPRFSGSGVLNFWLKGARHPYVGRSITMSLDICKVILPNVDFLRFVVLGWIRSLTTLSITQSVPQQLSACYSINIQISHKYYSI